MAPLHSPFLLCLLVVVSVLAVPEPNEGDKSALATWDPLVKPGMALRAWREVVVDGGYVAQTAFEMMPRETVFQLDFHPAVRNVMCRRAFDNAADAKLFGSTNHLVVIDSHFKGAASAIPIREGMVVLGSSCGCQGGLKSDSPASTNDVIFHRVREVEETEDGTQLVLKTEPVSPRSLLVSIRGTTLIGQIVEADGDDPFAAEQKRAAAERAHREDADEADEEEEEDDAEPMDVELGQSDGFDAERALRAVQGKRTLAGIGKGWNMVRGRIVRKSITLFSYGDRVMSLKCKDCYAYVNAKILVEWKFSVWGGSYVQAKGLGRFKANLFYELVLGRRWVFKDETILAKIPLTACPLSVGFGVTLGPNMVVGFGYLFDITAQLTVTWGARASYSIDAGGRVSKSGFTPIWKSPWPNLEFYPVKFSDKFKIKADVYIVVGIEVGARWGKYGASIGFYMNPGVELTLNRDFVLTKTYFVDFKVVGQIFSKTYRPLNMRKRLSSSTTPLLASSMLKGSLAEEEDYCHEVATLELPLGQTHIGSTTNYTTVFSEGLCGYLVGKQVVGHFVAPYSGVYWFRSNYSDYDTVLSLRTPTVCGVEISCNDDAIGEDTSMIEEFLEAGEEVILVSGGYWGEEGDLWINVEGQKRNLTMFWVDNALGNDGNPGSFEEPFATIRQALTVASAETDIHTYIKLLPGVYHISKRLELWYDDWADRELIISSQYGHKLGYGTAEDTIIDADFLNSMFFVDEDVLMQMKGLTLMNAVDCNFTGAAVSVEFGSVVLDSCVFKQNYVIGDFSSQTFVGGLGGAVSFFMSKDNIIRNCVFESNYAVTGGGAVYVGQDSNVEIFSSDFDDNRAEYGGAIYIGADVEAANGYGVKAVGCRFNRNSATVGEAAGGAIYNRWSDQQMVFEVCNFTDNMSSLGGAVFTFDGGINAKSCFFENNQAWGGVAVTKNYCGGAIASLGSGGGYEATVSLESCIFFNNMAVGFGGSVCVLDDSIADIQTTEFENNLAIYKDDSSTALGGAIYCQNSELVISGSWISGNSYNPRREDHSSASIFSSGCITNQTDCLSCDRCHQCLENGTAAVIDCTSMDPLFEGVCSPTVGCVYTQIGSAPEISYIVPSSTYVETQTLLTIVGEYFGSSVGDISSVLVGGSECANVTWYNSSMLQCTVPKAADPILADVRVLTVGGGSSMESVALEIRDPVSLACLKDLQLGGLILNPPFSREIFNYRFTLPPAAEKADEMGCVAPSVNVQVTPSSEGQAMMVNGVQVNSSSPSTLAVSMLGKKLIISVVSQDESSAETYVVSADEPRSGAAALAAPTALLVALLL